MTIHRAGFHACAVRRPGFRYSCVTPLRLDGEEAKAASHAWRVPEHCARTPAPTPSGEPATTQDETARRADGRPARSTVAPRGDAWPSGRIAASGRGRFSGSWA